MSFIEIPELDKSYGEKEILVLGDIHGNFKSVRYVNKVLKPKLIIQVGDFGYWPDFKSYKDEIDILETSVPILFIDGNHEDHNSLCIINDTKNYYIKNNVRYMPRFTLTKINEKNALFIGGALSIDRHQRHFMHDWFPQETISYSDMLDFNPDIDKIDIVFSHTCPWECEVLNIIPETDPSRTALSYILEKYSPDIWYFGHFHKVTNFTYKNTKFIGLNKVFDEGCYVWLD